MSPDRFLSPGAYLGMRDRGYGTEDIERIFKEAIRAAEQRREDENTELSNLLSVNVEIETKREDIADTDRLKERFDDRESLTSEELILLLRENRITDEELKEYDESVNHPS